MPFFIDVAIDDLWQVARTLHPASDQYAKVKRTMEQLVEMVSGISQMKFYLDDLSKYESEFQK